MSLRVLLAAAAALSLAACAAGPAPEPQPTLANLQTLRDAKIPPMAVGRFSAAPGVAKKTIAVRAATMTAPGGGDFSAYLADTLTAELRGAGKLDPQAPLVVNGTLNVSELSSGTPTGHGALGAEFIVTRQGALVFRKQLTVRSHWESDFLGAVGIPQAMNGYTAMYASLVAALLADPEFRAAIAA